MKRGKKCKYGGKPMYQEGGMQCTDPATGYPVPCDKLDPSLFRPSDAISANEVPSYQEPNQSYPYLDRIEEGIAQGVIEPKRADGSDEQQTANEQYWGYKGIPEVKNPQMQNNMTPQDLGIGLGRFTNLLSEISGRIERGRQNKRDYREQTSLGKFNPMPNSNFQPNPYSLYAKYGGKLKDYQQGGTLPSQGFINYMDIVAANQPKPSYKFPARLLSSGFEPSNIDSADYKALFNVANEDPSRYQRKFVDAAWGNYASALGTRHKEVQEQRLDFAQYKQNIMDDVNSQNRYKGAAEGLSAYPVSRKPMKYGGLKHAEYFGPPFSNGAKMDMTDGQKFDHMVVMRKIIPEMFNFRGTKKYYKTFQQGGNVFTSQEQITKANEDLRAMLTRQNAPQYLASNSVVARNVGDAMPTWSYPNGMPPQDATPKAATLPYGVDINQVQNTQEGYGYFHPQNGNFVKVDPSAVYGKYGQKPSQPVTTQSINAMAKAFLFGGKYRKGGKYKC